MQRASPDMIKISHAGRAVYLRRNDINAMHDLIQSHGIDVDQAANLMSAVKRIDEFLDTEPYADVIYCTKNGMIQETVWFVNKEWSTAMIEALSYIVHNKLS